MTSVLLLAYVVDVDIVWIEEIMRNIGLKHLSEMGFISRLQWALFSERKIT